MQYVSTRGAQLGSFSDVLLQGLAPDGGLAMPEYIPQIAPEELASLRSKSYAQIAFAVMRQFISDIPEQDLAGILQSTYTKERFRSEQITPLSRLGDTNLFHQ